MTVTPTPGLRAETGTGFGAGTGVAVDMSTSLAAAPLPSPVLTASGCSAFGQELDPFFDLSGIGAVVTKSVQLRPRSGRPTPRMAETPSGMLNSIGLQGPGIDGLLADDLPWLARRGARAFVSIAGTRVEDFAELAARLRGVPGVLGLEVNISCPNVESRGEVFACDPVAAADVVAAVRAAADPAQPVYAKLSPDVTDIVPVAASCADAGADGLSMINTLLGLVIDPDTMRPVLGGVTGGLSGPAIRPVALRCVWQVHQALPHVPILGMGGIRSGLDALQFVLAGASAVSVGTAVFNDPSAPARIHAELADALAARGFASLRDAVGYAHREAGT
jgi:dihydroorotate dehydrogenase (NAD+) catalytic subunit